MLLKPVCYTLCLFPCLFYLKDNSKEAYNEVGLQAIYCPMNGYLVDYASIIVHCIYQIANMNYLTCPSYGDLLTYNFNHFKVRLDKEGCVAQLVPMIFANSLEALCFYKTTSTTTTTPPIMIPLLQNHI